MGVARRALRLGIRGIVIFLRWLELGERVLRCLLTIDSMHQSSPCQPRASSAPIS